MKRLKDNGKDIRETKSVDCRKRDLVIRIADWTRTKDAPTYDVEVYIGGFYSQNDSMCCANKQQATEFASKKIAELL